MPTARSTPSAKSAKSAAEKAPGDSRDDVRRGSGEGERDSASEHASDGLDGITPLGSADALGRTALETCRQQTRRSHLTSIGVAQHELEAAHALVDMCDLALEECVRGFERTCAKTPVSDDAPLRQAANALWLASREYLRRHSIAEKASRQLQQHDAEKLGDLHFEYELEASALLSMRHAAHAYGKLRPVAA